MSVIFNVAGMIAGLAGSLVMASGMVLTEKEALKIGVGQWAGTSDEENKKIPAVRSLIRNSRNTKTGAWLLAAGFLLQIVGAVTK